MYNPGNYIDLALKYPFQPVWRCVTYRYPHSIETLVTLEHIASSLLLTERFYLNEQLMFYNFLRVL